MSIFTKDTFTTSDSFKDALKQVSESKIDTAANAVNENEVHVHGYGMVPKHLAEREAHASTQEAIKHATTGNHGNAAYHHDRAAMFHKALHNHNNMLQSKMMAHEQVIVNPTVQEETKEPDVGRVESKYKRQLARNMKKKDAEKKEKGEDKWK